MAAEDAEVDFSEYRFAGSDTLNGLGHLRELAGTWEGCGMNLIARPAFHYKALNPGPPPFQPDLFLQINYTRETLTFRPIGSKVPNRGFQPGQNDVILYGLTYLQQISDAAIPGIGAMHIEPGIWMRENPLEVNPDDTPPPGGEVVTRMASIPHGTTVLAQGIAQPFTGTPVLPSGSVAYNGSLFPAFNSTPFAIAPFLVPGQNLPKFSAANTSMAGLAAVNGPPPFPNFPQYTLTNPLTNHDPGSRPVGLTQDEINDPIVVLQKAVQKNLDEGYRFEGGISLNICTQKEVDFEPAPNLLLFPPPPTPPPAPVAVIVPQFNGGAQNTVFLADRPTATPPKPNAATQVVYATFWIEKLKHKHMGHNLLQLQYAQMVTLNFPAINLQLLLPGSTQPQALNLAWPHISVGTLHKIFA